MGRRTETGEQRSSSMMGRDRGLTEKLRAEPPLPVAVAMTADLRSNGFLVRWQPRHEDEELGDRRHQW